MPTTQYKAHLQPIFKGRYYFGCKRALHFPSISSFIFLPSLKTKFSATRKSPTDNRQRLNYLLRLTRQLRIPLTRQTNRPVYNFILLQRLVVDGFQRCNLKLLFRQTRLCSPDSPPLQAIQFRWLQA